MIIVTDTHKKESGLVVTMFFLHEITKHYAILEWKLMQSTGPKRERAPLGKSG